MRTNDVIDTAPAFSGLAAWLLLASQYSEGALSNVFNVAGLVVSLLTLGALIAHFPGRAGQAADGGPEERCAG